MLKSYLSTALRHLTTRKLYSAINIVGLAVGLVCFILIALFVRHELAFDRHYANADRIYRVSREFFPEGDSSLELSVASIAAPAAPLLQQDFPEIERTARLYRGDFLISSPELSSYELDYWADPGLFEIFDFEWLRGDAGSALAEPFSLVLTETTARKYFGADDPMGGTLTVDGRPARVTGVIRDLGDDTHLRFDLLGSFETLDTMLGEEALERWDNNAFHTYVLLEEDADAGEIEHQSDAFFERHVEQGSSEFTGFAMQALPDVHLRSNREGEISTPGSIGMVYAFAAIAAFVLLIACINFMNLATARSADRAKEIGIRKSLGADRRQMAMQFLGESVLFAVVAMTLAAAVAELALPAFGAFMQEPLTLDYTSEPEVLAALGALALVVGLVAGSYPAFYLSAFEPARVLKGEVTRGRSAATVRKVLVVSQFAISIALLIATAIVYLQTRFARDIDLGFEKAQVVVLEGSPTLGLGEQWEALERELIAHPEISHVTASGLTPAGGQGARATSVRFEGGTLEGLRGVPVVPVDYGFFETYGIEVLAGRVFSPEFGADRLVPPSEDRPQTSAAYVLSELAARQFGWAPDEALGKWFEMSFGNRFGLSARGPIVGVVADAHFQSVRTPVEPLVYLATPARVFGQPILTHASLKLTGRNLGETLDFIDATWSEFMPGEPATRRFVDQDLQALYEREERQSRMLAAFSALAIFVACLGLLGLASFTTEQRTKEIGVRKVMGGTVWDIVRLFSGEFGRLVAVANVIAWPAAYFAMRRWLDGFAYRIDMSLDIFVGGALLALAVALVTVGAIAARAATVNPVHSLRYE